jgi:hypothetical protein
MLRSSKASGVGLMQRADRQLFQEQRAMQDFVSVQIESRTGWRMF